jgi:hypothetical protein
MGSIDLKNNQVNLKDLVIMMILGISRMCYQTGDIVRIPKPMYALGLARKSLAMLIAKGYSCS